MRTKILYFLFLLLSINKILFAQLTQAEKEQIISELDSTNVHVTVYKIIWHNIVEAVPIIESKFWQKDHWVQQYYLKALCELKSTKTREFALAYIDSADKVIDDNPIELKVYATSILFKLGDYSTAHYIFDLIKTKIALKELSYVDLLPDVIKHVSQYADSAKKELKRIVEIPHENIGAPYMALKYYDELFGEECLPIAVKKFMSNSDASGSSRVLALEILWKHKYNFLDSLLRERIKTEPYGTYRIEIAKYLLAFGLPKDLKYIKDYLINEPDTTAKSLIGYSIKFFKPFKSNKNISVQVMLDTLSYYNLECSTLNWLDNNLLNELDAKIQNAKTYLLNSDSLNCAQQIKSFRQKVDFEYYDTLNTTASFVTEDAYKFLHYYAQYILDRLPALPTDLIVNLKSSTGTLLTSGSLQYYEGSWKDAINNGDGTFIVITNLNSVSLRITYEYGSQTVSNINAHNNTYTFQTVNAQVQLKNSMDEWLNGGMVQYYSGAWRNFGITSNGIASKELLPANYSFRMTYSFASKDKQQDIGVNPTVVFQTVAANVQLKNSMDEWLNGGMVQYYSGAWREFGTATNGTAVKELLPNNYSFRMTYAYASKDKQQDVGVNPVVVFQTVAANVQLQNSSGNLIDQGTVQYYSGAWREFGSTTNGVAVKELLPNNYSFRMTYAFASKDKQQDLSTNPVVVFQTVAANVQLKSSINEWLNGGMVQYYSGAWREFGTTANGIAVKELLPNNYSFRMTYEYVSNDKVQDIGVNPVVNFSTVLCTIRVRDSQSNPVNNATASYYSGAWRQIGNTVNGEITKELLPANLAFRIIYGAVQQDKTQNLAVNNVVEINLP